MTDYWMSRLFFDLQDPALRAEYRADREKVMARYPLKPEAKAALLVDDVAAIAPRVNPYLLRYYFGFLGWNDETFIRRIRETRPEAAHG